MEHESNPIEPTQQGEGTPTEDCKTQDSSTPESGTESITPQDGPESPAGQPEGESTEDRPEQDQPEEKETQTEENQEQQNEGDAGNGKVDKDEPTQEEAVTDNPTQEEAVTDDPTQEEAVTDDPTQEEAVTDDPTQGGGGEEVDKHTNVVTEQAKSQDPEPESPEEKAPEVNMENNIANGTAEEDEMYSYMSTHAEVVDVEALRQAVADIRSDASGVDRKSWLIVGHVDNNPNLVDIVAKDVSEEASLDGFAEKLQDDQVMYAIVRLTTTVDMSTTVKFVYIHWVGDHVPYVKRGRYGVVHGSIESYFNPYHVMLETGNPDELSEAEIIKNLDQKNMTANRIVETPTDKHQQRGFTQHQVNRAGGVLSPKSVAPVGNVVEVSPEVNETIGAIRNDSSPVTWLLASYEDNNVKKPLILTAKGSGSIEELKDELQNDRVMYGLLRTSDVYDEITTVKFVYIYWVGEQVKPIFKGKVYANAGSVEQIFSPMHVTLSLSSVDEVTAELISDKVTASSGSKSFVK